MAAINRPIDILLNVDTVSSTRSAGQSSELTDSNKRENSFDEVFSAQRRESRQRGDEKTEVAQEQTNREVKPSRVEDPAERTRVESGGNEAVEDGKELPPEETKVAESAEPEEESGQDKFVLPVSQFTEEAGNGDDGVEGGTKRDESLVSSTLDESKLEPEQTVIGTPPVAGEVAKGAAQSGSTVPLIEQGRATPVAPVLTPQDQLKQVVNKVTNTGLAPDSELNRADGQKPDLPFSGESKGEVKLDLLSRNQGRQLPPGLELKQWLETVRLNADPKVPVANSAAVPAAPTSTPAADTVSPLRLTSLTQSIQALTASRPTAGAVTIQTPVNSAAWGQVVAQRVAWLAGNGVRVAELHLNPQELGPVEVKISVNNDQTNIHFTSHQASVREALELSVHRLRDMLESNGLNLADVDVSDQSDSEQGEVAANSAGGDPQAGEMEPEADSGLVRVAETSSLVDYYV